MDEYITREAAIKAIYESDPFGVHKYFGWRAMDIEEALRAIPAVDVEKMSDGYHTFADLYEQRLILSAALAKNNPYAWKSKRHEDGSEPFGGGWFIMGFDTDEGCYTYHYELKDWDLFQCKELDKGKPWDGHTSKDVRRLLSIPAVSVPQWISIKDRLPDVNRTGSGYEEITVIATDGESVHPMIYERACIRGKTKYRWKWIWDRIYEGKPIVAWMLLPKAPKGDSTE